MNKYNINKAILYSGTGIELIKNRSINELVSSDCHFNNCNENIFICDENFAYGIIKVNSPSQVDVEQFNNRFNRHKITNEFRRDVIGEFKSYNVYTFRIKRMFKKPLEHNFKGDLVFGKFIKNIDVIDEKVLEYRNRLLEIKNIKSNNKLKPLFENLYELFLNKYNEKLKKNLLEKSNVQK